MKKLNKKTMICVIVPVIVLLSIVLIVIFVFLPPQYLLSRLIPQASTGTQQIAPSTPPSWLSIVYPEQGQNISLKEYESSPVDPSSICIEIAPAQLTEPGDSWNAELILKRTIVLVDKIQSHKLPASRVWDFMGARLDGTAIGPYAFCVYAPVTAGVHLVEVSFETSSGEKPVFAWTFTVFDGDIPTSTPLPIAATIDREKHLPPFLRAVYPSPGQVVSLQQNVNPDEEDERVWTWEGRSKENLKKMQGTICLAFRRDIMETLGTFPSEIGDWPTRIYMQVDGHLADWMGPSYLLSSVDSERLQIHCSRISLEVGKHIVALYLHPYDADLTSYSWEFTITK